MIDGAPNRRGTRARVALLFVAACGGREAPPPEPVPRPAPPPPPAASLAPPAESASTPVAADDPPGPCPADMAYVDTQYCPDPALRCLKSEYDKSNHITICYEFAPGQRCRSKTRRERYCIDRYEYPNREGAHPPVMVSWYDGDAACSAEGKRLCWESEWVAACEGPEKLPFPYGLRRDSEQCNIDNTWLKPDLGAIYSPKPDVRGPELLRLDQSVASGQRAGCVSGFGVHDLTGNVDEWVNAESPHKVSGWAGLKGGAWGHVRNACRPMTTSHTPDFTYYFISFRCCKDAGPDASADADPSLWRAPRKPDHPPPGGRTSAGWTTDERGPNRPK